MARLDEVSEPGDPVLVLFEDNDIATSKFLLTSNLHLLSTKSFLLGLEARRLIPSADAVWQAIQNAGRAPSERALDRPGTTTKGERTDW